MFAPSSEPKGDPRRSFRIHACRNWRLPWQLLSQWQRSEATAFEEFLSNRIKRKRLAARRSLPVRSKKTHGNGKRNAFFDEERAPLTVTRCR